MPSNGRKRKRGGGHKKDFRERAATFTSEDIISKSDLEGDDVLSLPDLRTKNITEIQATAEEMGIENISRARRQDITFSILKAHAAEDKRIFGEGVLEILQDGFGFLRSADTSYIAGPDDVYVSPTQIRKFNLRTGDTVSGSVRPPKDNERYFALLKVSEINFEDPENVRTKALFENLTPYFPEERFQLEQGTGSVEDLTARIIDLASPIGKGQRSLIISPPLEPTNTEQPPIVMFVDSYPGAEAKLEVKQNSFPPSINDNIANRFVPDSIIPVAEILLPSAVTHSSSDKPSDTLLIVATDNENEI